MKHLQTEIQLLRADNLRLSAIIKGLLDRIEEEEAVYRELLRDNTTLQHIATVNESAKLQAENEVHAKDRFIAVLSHELRTPLSVILGWIPILQKKKDDQTVFDLALESIQRNAKVQAELIENLIDLSRVLVGKRSADTTVDFAEVVTEVVQSVDPILKAKQLAIDVHVEKSSMAIAADPLHIRQVVSNLLSNSIKFTNDGGKITVSLSSSQERLKLEIRDTGRGIKPQFLPHVFEMFAQESTNGNEGGGLGLGLALVRKLTELHGGTVEAASRGEMLGSTFTVTFPHANTSRLRTYAGAG